MDHNTTSGKPSDHERGYTGGVRDSALPRMDRVTTRMVRGKIENNDVASIEKLIDVSLDSGAEPPACRVTIDLLV